MRATASPTRTSRGARLRGPVRPHPARLREGRPATPGSASSPSRGRDRRGARRRRDDLRRLRGVDRRDVSSATWTTSVCTTRSTGRASSAPGPGRAIPAPRRSSCMHRWVTSRARPGVGLRRGRHGQGVVRDRRGGAGGGRRARRGRPRRRIVPGEGVVLESGELDPRAASSSRNADPKRTLAMLGAEARRTTSATASTPGTCAPGRQAERGAEPAARLQRRGGLSRSGAMVTITRRHRRRCRTRSRPASAASPRPASRSSTSRPHTTRRSPRRATTRCASSLTTRPTSSTRAIWDSRRDEIGGASSTRSPASLPTSPIASTAVEVLGPPDIEARIGLTGGHIFQGE